jgi:hypothetical protein
MPTSGPLPGRRRSLKTLEILSLALGSERFDNMRPCGSLG